MTILHADSTPPVAHVLRQYSTSKREWFPLNLEEHMAQYRGTVSGQRGTASRLGSKSSGLTVTANGWDIGARVVVNHEDGRDSVSVFLTHGSNNGGHAQCLGMFRLASDGTFEQIGGAQ